MEIKQIEEFFNEENTGKGWEYTHSGIDVMPTDFVREIAIAFAKQFIDLAAQKAKKKWDFGHTHIESAYVDKQSILKLKELIK